MMRELYRLRSGHYTAIAREEAPRARTLLVGGRLRRVQMPRLCFIEHHHDDTFLALCVGQLLEYRPPHHTRVLTGYPNIWPVCFGHAQHRVAIGGLDPIEAFWMTSFSDTPQFEGNLVLDWRNYVLERPPRDCMEASRD